MASDYPNGISSFGVPVLPGYPYIHSGSTTNNGGSVLRANKHVWVHGQLGNDGNNGLSPDKPKLTMSAALNMIGSGDIVHLTGKVTESITAPAGVFDVTIIGEGNAPRHADAHTTNNGYSTAQWNSAATTTSQLTLQQQGWKIMNILFDAPTSAAAIVFPRNASSGDSERDSSHAQILGCRFASGSMGIQITGTENVFNVLVAGNTFNDLTTAIDSSGGYAYRWQIIGNNFTNNTNHIDVGFNAATITDNVFGEVTTLGVDLTGGTNNVVSRNIFHGDYNVLNVAGTTDAWGGNYVSGETAGISTTDPTGS
jgi:hypothetical protein